MINSNSLKNLTYRLPKGHVPWNKGKKFPQAIVNLTKWNAEDHTGDKNSNWRGGKPKCNCGEEMWYEAKQCRKCAGLSRRKKTDNLSTRQVNYLERRRFRKDIQKYVLNAIIKLRSGSLCPDKLKHGAIIC